MSPFQGAGNRLAECKDTVAGKNAMRAETVLLLQRTAKKETHCP